MIHLGSNYDHKYLVANNLLNSFSIFLKCYRIFLKCYRVFLKYYSIFLKCYSIFLKYHSVFLKHEDLSLDLLSSMPNNAGNSVHHFTVILNLACVYVFWQQAV